MPPEFLYHTEAVGASGHITVPVVDSMPMQASVASAIGASFGTARVENFKHLSYLSIGSIESHVISSFSKRDQAYGTLASVVIEDLNILNVVTIDRMVTRLTSKHDKHETDGAAPGSYILHGTQFHGLKVAGHDIDFKLSTGLFSELSTWDKLIAAYQDDASAQKELDELSLYTIKDKKNPAPKGVFSVSLAHFPKLPRGLSRKGHGVYVPHFGTIYPARYYITPTSRKLRMLHVDLGCTVEGDNGYGDTGGGGTPLPGSA